MSPRRETHPGLIGWAERARLESRHPPLLRLFRDLPSSRQEEASLAGIGRTISDGKSFFFGEFQAPTREELDTLAQGIR